MYYQIPICALCIDVFFFQAEDGIRDLVRSRGLGDVYKRQILGICRVCVSLGSRTNITPFEIEDYRDVIRNSLAVSYTHLTLPTIYSV